MDRVDPKQLRTLVADVAQFHVTDRRLRHAQERITALLAAGDDVPPKAARAYLDALRRYFGGFQREARAHLSDVERRLTRVSQVQFNLTAERSVAARRVELTQGVLARIAEIDRR